MRSFLDLPSQRTFGAPSNAFRSRRRPRVDPVAATEPGSRGFTRLDCLACVAGVALLALLVVPVLAATPGRAHGVVCSSNLGRLLTAWTQYAQDNDGRLPVVRDAGGGWMGLGLADL